MALSDYEKMNWSDVNNLFRRIVSERGRWNGVVGSTPTKPKLNGSEVTLANNPGASTFNGQGKKFLATDIASWRQTLLDLANARSELSAYINGSKRTSIGLAAETTGVRTLTQLKEVVNNMRTTFGYSNTTEKGTVVTGFSSHKTSQSYWDYGYSEVWAFASAEIGCFGHSGAKSFGFTVNNTAHNPNCVNCTSGFTSNSSNFAAGFCSSYYSDAI